MSEINLSSAVRSSLSSLQATADLLTTTQERLATGNRVNSALDDATSFFTASGLTSRASDLSTLLDQQQQAIRTVEAADEGITAITDLVESARAQASTALQSDDATVRADAARAFDEILGQIETLAGDASFNGINLLDSLNSTDLTVVFNEDNTASLTVEGVNFTDAAAGLGLNRVSSVNNASGAGAAVASSTQATSNDFSVGQASTFTVGNSNGTTTSFDVTFEDTDATAVTNGVTTVAASDFNGQDTFSIEVGGQTLNVGQITDADNSGTDAALTIDVSTLASAPDSTTTFTVTVGGETLSLGAGDAGSAADIRTNLQAAIDANDNLAGQNIVVGGTGNDIELSSNISDITATFGVTSTEAFDTGNGDGTAFVNGIDGDDVAAAINAAVAGDANFDADGLTAAFNTNTGNIELTSNLGNADVNSNNAAANGTDSAVTVTDTVDFEAATGVGLSTDEITAQINAAAAAAGVNTANGAFSVTSAADATDPTVTNFTFTSDTGNISIANGTTAVASSAGGTATDTAFVEGNGGGSDFADADAINQTLAAIDDALGTLRSSAATLGSDLSTIQIRQDFTSNLIEVLEQGAGDLTLADLNEEGANLLTLQTRQQLASTSLSFATQADQSVLSLF